MFNNANVIFRTKFVDGVSTVTRTVQRRAEEGHNEHAKGAKGLASMRCVRRKHLLRSLSHHQVL